MKGKPVRSRERFLVFGSPMIGEEEVREVVSSMRSGWLGTGPKVAMFEEDFKSYKGARHAVAVNSCTSAQMLAAELAGLGPGAEAVVPAFTWISTSVVTSRGSSMTRASGWTDRAAQAFMFVSSARTPSSMLGLKTCSSQSSAKNR